MELHHELAQKGLSSAIKKRNWIYLLAGFGFTSYGAYRLYHSPSIARKRARVSSFFSAFSSVAESITYSADSIGIISKDLKDFLRSDSDQIPNSFKQLAKIARSEEIYDSFARMTQAITIGFLRAYRQDSNGEIGFPDRALDKLLGPGGTGFASAVVGSYARNLILGLFSNGDLFNSKNGEDWVNVICCNDKCRAMIGDCVQLFISTAISTYLEKTKDINLYSDFFSGLTDPSHAKDVKVLLTSISNAAVETLIRTSHQVLSGSNPELGSSTSSRPHLKITGRYDRYDDDDDEDEDDEDTSTKKISFHAKRGRGLAQQFASALAIPSNKKFVMDVTGKVTFETVRSVMQFLVEKVCESMQRRADVVQEKGAEIMRYAAIKSTIIASICLSLCAQVLDGVWILSSP